jgi:acyl carrier protein
MSKVEERVKKVIADLLGIKDEIANDTHIGDLELDSLDAVELILTFEEEFDCEIHDDDLSYRMTVQQIIEYIESKV